MSVYRTIHRIAQNDVHRVAEHVVTPAIAEPKDAPVAPPRDWTPQRKARPVETLLPVTRAWIETLPPEARPEMVGRRYPRIANQLAARWKTPPELAAYLMGLLVDTRGNRKGFPLDVLRELNALKDLYLLAHPHCFDGLDRLDDRADEAQHAASTR